MTKKEDVRKKNRKKGFTLVELLIVVAIIAILAAIAIPQYNKYVRKAAAANAQAALSACLGELMAQFADNGSDNTTCKVITSKNGSATGIKLYLDNNGNIKSINGTSSTEVTFKVKGHKVKCKVDNNTNTINCEPV